jgi:hypothetical protein
MSLGILEKSVEFLIGNPLVAFHRGINLQRPGVDAAGQIYDVVEALRLQKALGPARAHSVMAIEDDGFVRGEFLGAALLELAQGNQFRFGQMKA